MSKKFHYSLLLLFIFGIIGTYYQPANGSIQKIIVNSYVYISLVFIPLGSILSYKKYFTNKSEPIFLLLMGYGLFTISRNLFDGEFASLFGNPLFGPSFLVPLFILWGVKDDAIYWLHRISMLSIKIGILITPIALLSDIKLPAIAFVPTFFLILNYKYAPPKDKILILVSIIIGLFVFWEGDYRSGIIRILISFCIFMLLQLNLKKTYKYAVWTMLAIPIYGIYLGIAKNESIFAEIGKLGINSEKNILVDTRTFLYAELISDQLRTNTIILGKGPLGTYYSEYFANWSFDNGDSDIRHNVEIGVLHYLLKGGIIYLILIFWLMILIIYQSIKKAKNQYIISLSLVLTSFLLYSFVENIPSYSFYIAPIWIIAGICSSQKFIEYDDIQIKEILRNKTRQVPL